MFGTGLKRIKKHAFHNCKALTKVNLPDGISNYSVTLFEGCSNLSELTMPEWMEKRRSDIMNMPTERNKPHVPRSVHSIGAPDDNRWIRGALEEVEQVKQIIILPV